MESLEVMDVKQWIEFIVLIAGALGSIATVGAFIYLFRRDKDKQTQIDKLSGMVLKLATIAEALQMQLYQDKDNTRLMFMPSLKFAGHTVIKEGP